MSQTYDDQVRFKSYPRRAGKGSCSMKIHLARLAGIMRLVLVPSDRIHGVWNGEALCDRTRHQCVMPGSVVMSNRVGQCCAMELCVAKQRSLVPAWEALYGYTRVPGAMQGSLV